MDPEFLTIQEREDRLVRLTKELTDKEAAAADKEQNLDKREKALAAKEKAQERKNGSFEAYLAGLSDARLKQLRQIAGILLEYGRRAGGGRALAARQRG